tara:strand:+ start:1038 stop:1343 length:306 start_codon:yes stop_codon:yes gene_type:complete
MMEIDTLFLLFMAALLTISVMGFFLFPTARRMVLGPPDNIVIHFINKGGYNLESDCQGSDPPIRSVWWIDTEKFGKANVSHQTTMQLKAERLPNTRIHTKT